MCTAADTLHVTHTTCMLIEHGLVISRNAVNVYCRVYITCHAHNMYAHRSWACHIPKCCEFVLPRIHYMSREYAHRACHVLVISRNAVNVYCRGYITCHAHNMYAHRACACHIPKCYKFVLPRIHYMSRTQHVCSSSMGLSYPEML